MAVELGLQVLPSIIRTMVEDLQACMTLRRSLDILKVCERLQFMHHPVNGDPTDAWSMKETKYRGCLCTNVHRGNKVRERDEGRAHMCHVTRTGGIDNPRSRIDGEGTRLRMVRCSICDTGHGNGRR